MSFQSDPQKLNSDVLTLLVAASVILEYYSIDYTRFTQSESIKNLYCKVVQCGPTIFLTSSLFMITYIAFDRHRVLTRGALAKGRSSFAQNFLVVQLFRPLNSKKTVYQIQWNQNGYCVSYNMARCSSSLYTLYPSDQIQRL